MAMLLSLQFLCSPISSSSFANILLSTSMAFKNSHPSFFGGFNDDTELSANQRSHTNTSQRLNPNPMLPFDPNPNYGEGPWQQQAHERNQAVQSFQSKTPSNQPTPESFRGPLPQGGAYPVVVGGPSDGVAPPIIRNDSTHQTAQPGSYRGIVFGYAGVPNLVGPGPPTMIGGGVAAYGHDPSSDTLLPAMPIPPISGNDVSAYGHDPGPNIVLPAVPMPIPVSGNGLATSGPGSGSNTVGPAVSARARSEISYEICGYGRCQLSRPVSSIKRHRKSCDGIFRSMSNRLIHCRFQTTNLCNKSMADLVAMKRHEMVCRGVYGPDSEGHLYFICRFCFVFSAYTAGSVSKHENYCFCRPG